MKKLPVFAVAAVLGMLLSGCVVVPVDRGPLRGYRSEVYLAPVIEVRSFGRDGYGYRRGWRGG